MLIKLTFTVLIFCICTAASAQSLNLTNNVPPCRAFSGKPLPPAYYRPQDGKDFAWVGAVSATDAAVGGPGWERIDGSGIRDWFDFYRVDIDNDGRCDWFVTMLAPTSSGGDHDSLNTIYLNRGQAWRRIGATIPSGKPDSLGLGKSSSQQSEYLFGEEIGVVHDQRAGVNYIISAFYSRSPQQQIRPGYRIFVWDANANKLRLIDKWQSGSLGAQIYAFFKANGAWLPHSALEEADLYKFDPEIETLELQQACDPDSAWRTTPKLYGAVSPALLLKCPR